MAKSVTGGAVSSNETSLDKSLKEASGADAGKDTGGVEAIRGTAPDEPVADNGVEAIDASVFGTRKTRGPVRSGKPQVVNYKSYIVSTRGRDVARIKKAIDESDAIAQVVKAFRISEPENYNFQCRIG